MIQVPALMRFQGPALLSLSYNMIQSDNQLENQLQAHTTSHAAFDGALKFPWDVNVPPTPTSDAASDGAPKSPGDVNVPPTPTSEIDSKFASNWSFDKCLNKMKEAAEKEMMYKILYGWNESDTASFEDWLEEGNLLMRMVRDADRAGKGVDLEEGAAGGEVNRVNLLRRRSRFLLEDFGMFQGHAVLYLLNKFIQLQAHATSHAAFDGAPKSPGDDNVPPTPTSDAASDGAPKSPWDVNVPPTPTSDAASDGAPKSPGDANVPPTPTCEERKCERKVEKSVAGTNSSINGPPINIFLVCIGLAGVIITSVYQGRKTRAFILKEEEKTRDACRSWKEQCLVDFMKGFQWVLQNAIAEGVKMAIPKPTGWKV